MANDTLTTNERLILQAVARKTENPKHSGERAGWTVYGIPQDDDGGRWEWNDYRPLVERGLVEREEDWKHVYLRMTPAGWEALSYA